LSYSDFMPSDLRSYQGEPKQPGGIARFPFSFVNFALTIVIEINRVCDPTQINSLGFKNKNTLI